MACRDWQIKTFDLIAASKCFSVELAAIIFFLHLHSKSLVRRITWALCLFSLVMPLLDTKNMCFLKLNQMQKCTPGVTACNRGDSRSRSWKWPKTLCMHPVHYTRGVIFKTHTSGIQVNNHNQSRTLRYFFAGTATAYSNLCDYGGILKVLMPDHHLKRANLKNVQNSSTINCQPVSVSYNNNNFNRRVQMKEKCSLS